ncbi:ABC transporter permease [Terriglobus saanensis]|uniref:Permease n=1 Tax=Terriglobus saanensis (strain ATCC BAA-1853 / DSM 23119 / SP1PR4) TaxID=401053 RepID=E8V8K9_TERSS|nr:ABC transporter permease [Terriglobus saanensis]ADV82988.1 permease [Terriglobus saanensis SP1PR4]
MGKISQFFKKVLVFVRRDKFHRDLEEEMAFHREMAEEDLVGHGAGSGEAHYAAKRVFGNETRLREQSHEVMGFRMESVLHDLRFALRQLRRSPGFACTAIGVLTLGVAASVTIFSFVDAALMKPLPYKDSSRLVAVYEKASFCPLCNISYPDYLDFKKQNKVFSALDAWAYSRYLWKSSTGVESMQGARVASGFFHTLGVSPALGRDFTEADDTPAASRTVLLSYDTWQRRFGGRREVLGQTVTLDDTAYSVIGVLPREFHFAPRGNASFWTPLHHPTGCEKRRSCHNLFAAGRLKEGVSVATALAEMQTIAGQLERQYPDSNLGQGAAVIALSDAIVGDVRPILLVLLGGAGLLLLIACVNVASLLLVRAENRRREMAVRGALGASPGRLVRQFVTEGLVLVTASMTLGVVSAYGLSRLLLKLIPAEMLGGMPYLQGAGIGPHVLMFAALIAVIAATIFSVTPLIRLSLSDLRGDLGEGGRGAAGTMWKRFGSNLVAVELAIAVVLLVGAGLLSKSFYRLLHVEMNFQPDHLATLSVAAPNANYGKDEQMITLSDRVVGRIARLPGVISVGHTNLLPVSCNCNTTWFRVLGHPFHGEHNDAPERGVTTEYFKTIQARLMRGRFFTETDDASKPQVMVINQTLAKQFFPGEDPIDKMIGNTDLAPKSMRKIVGVVDDIREGTLEQEIRPAIYIPFKQEPDTDFSLVARTAQDPSALLPEMVAAIREIDPNLAVINGTTMSQRIGDSQTAYLHRSSAWMVGAFASLALLMGVVGLYGVIAYSVSQRTREIGVRIALGAPRGSVYRMILGEAGMLTVIGIAGGLASSIAVARLMRKLLFGVQAWDVATLLAVAVALGVSAMVASYLPARRAASVNPVEALRAE